MHGVGAAIQMMFLTEKEKVLLSKQPNRTYVVTYQFGKELKTQIVVGKACGVMPVSEDVSMFCVYDENGIESFACDFDSFLTVVEKASGRLRRHKKENLRLLQTVPTEK